MAAEIIFYGRDGANALFVTPLHRGQHFLGMFGNHLAVEHAVVHVADEHQVVGIMGELGRADRISARTVG